MTCLEVRAIYNAFYLIVRVGERTFGVRETIMVPGGISSHFISSIQGGVMVSSLLVIVFSCVVLAWSRTSREPGRGGAVPRNRIAPKLASAAVLLFTLLLASGAMASEAELKIPDLTTVSFLGMTGHNLLVWGLLVCLLGMAFGFVQYTQIRNLPVHQAMREISELIWETCKTYLITQGK
ncbi:MAG TPA: hypothetical protein VLM86_01090, partial [Candidatus Bathyarchaeia archaeon]|nr:hypothetical protein [Candidatus Bathyarchaeia archaeon]